MIKSEGNLQKVKEILDVHLLSTVTYTRVLYVEVLMLGTVRTDEARRPGNPGSIPGLSLQVLTETV